MHLLRCLLLFGWVLLGYSSSRIHSPDRHTCVQVHKRNENRIAGCDYGDSASQLFVLDGEFIKNPESGLCLSTRLAEDRKLANSSLGPAHVANKTMLLEDMKMKVEGKRDEF
jgi:hypothetical protein